MTRPKSDARQTAGPIDAIAELESLYRWQKQRLISIPNCLAHVKAQEAAIRELRATAVALAELQRQS